MRSKEPPVRKGWLAPAIDEEAGASPYSLLHYSYCAIPTLLRLLRYSYRAISDCQTLEIHDIGTAPDFCGDGSRRCCG